MANKNIDTIITALRDTLNVNTFVKMTMGNYKGAETDLKKIIIKPIIIKKGARLSFTYRYQTKDIVKNYPYEEATELITQLLGSDFHAAVLFSTENDWQLSSNKGKYFLLKTKPQQQEAPSMAHDKKKKRLLESQEKKYLHELKITNEKGDVYKNAQDKYRQINRYIETLSKPLRKFDKQSTLRVVDMGAGKGYLTFALYDYLTNNRNIDATVTGIEYRQELVDLCNQIAQNSNFDQLKFEQGTIEAHEIEAMDVLIALHACDTATDEAIFKGITSNAELIVVAPCCHHQIRQEIEKNKVKNELDFLLKYGIFLERQAEMVTDGIRALILEYFGYSTKVFQFISDAHTPKNVLVVGTKNKQIPIHSEAILEQIKTIKNYFGIDYHHLEKLMKLTT